MDSMVNHYTADRKRRNDDAYSPDGAAGQRPDRSVIVYSNAVERRFPGFRLWWAPLRRASDDLRIMTIGRTRSGGPS